MILYIKKIMQRESRQHFPSPFIMCLECHHSEGEDEVYIHHKEDFFISFVFLFLL